MRTIRKIALMAVGDDGWQGGIQYILNLINGINSVANSDIQIDLFKHAGQKFYNLEKFNNVKINVVEVESAFAPFSVYNRAKWFFLRKTMKRINPRLEEYFIKNNYDFVYPGVFSDVKNKLNSGAWITDFQSFHFPDGADREFNENTRKYLAKIAENSNKLILSSVFCEKDCHQFFPITKHKTFAMPFAVYIDESVFEFNDFDQIRSMYSLPNQFLVVANLFAPTKNHITLFKALGLLKQEGIRIDLVCTGNIVDYRNLGFANEILQLLTKNKIRDQVHMLGLIPREHQVAMFRMATAMVQPSVNEGWSTCVEEAKVLGKKLLLSDIELHREQYPENPYFFEPLNEVSLAQKIKNILIEAEGADFPERKLEMEAYAQYQQSVKAFGKKFLEIAAA
jgi:glycosyltransferase involved in cell wall biosynthesis